MAKEIERKFLISTDEWRDRAQPGMHLTQAYLLSATDRSARVRIIDNISARLTLKFGRNSLVRDEFEYDIPLNDAHEMIGLALGFVINKTRYCVQQKDFLWEIDVFHGPHTGLVMAEVELPDQTASPNLPTWLGREVTNDHRFSNQALAEKGRTPQEEG